MRKFPPLGFDGKELDQIFNFIYLIETINFVQHEFISPFMLDDLDYPPMRFNPE